jgi:ribosomal protein L12E/L44/L45/RPP1/RPP2
MNSMKWLRNLLFPLTALLLTLSFAASAAQNEPSQKEKESKKEAKEERKEAAAQATPVLWKEPTDIATRDLFNGPGGEGMKPDLSQVVWDGDDDPGGYSVKWDVRDGAGKKWVAKLGKEAQPETVAVRLVWAAGYMTEINYLVPCVHIVNAPKPRKSVERCEGNGFANVRFKARPKDMKKLDNWSWNDNPFKGTKEFQGLVVMMALLNNWDLKDVNNKTFYVPGDGGQGELQYVVSDLGATFGQTGGPISHSRNEPQKYLKSGFVDVVKGNRVKFDYHGKDSSLFDNITVEQAKWIGDLLSQLSKQQIDDAFRAANYKPEEIEALSYEVRARINELHSLNAPAATSTGQ